MTTRDINFLRERLPSGHLMLVAAEHPEGLIRFMWRGHMLLVCIRTGQVSELDCGKPSYTPVAELIEHILKERA